MTRSSNCFDDIITNTCHALSFPVFAVKTKLQCMSYVIWSLEFFIAKQFGLPYTHNTYCISCIIELVETEKSYNTVSHAKKT